VDEPGSRYYFRFRYCVKNAAGVETCTAWGNPGTPGGTPSPVPTATPVATAAPTATPAPTHVVKFVNKVLTGRNSMVIDAIKEGVTYLQDSNARLTYSGTWTVGTDSAPSGGSYKGTVVSGASISVTTSEPTIYYRTYRYSTRSDVEVYVDGVLKTTLTGLNTGTGWVDLPIAL
jgi:hypothetical protein